MVKTLRILLLGLAIVLSGTAMAQNKTADRNARQEKVMKLKKGGVKHAKKAKKASLFTKTTIFSEDFTTGLDTTWRTYDVDGDGWNWLYDSYSEAMLSYSYDTDNYNPITPIDYLITPKITIPSTGANLSFNAWAVDDWFPYDHYFIRVSPSGSDDVDSFYTTIYYDSVPDVPQNYQVSLAQFAGQQIRIAFVHVDTVDYWAMAIDDVEVFSLDSVDLAVTGTNVIGVSTSSASATITADVENLGFATINNLTVYCDVNGTVTNTTIASLANSQTATASFTSINFSNTGTYNIKFYVAVPGDADNSNDTLSTVTVVAPAASITWDFEGDTNLPAGFTVGRYDNGTAVSSGLFPNNEAWNVVDVDEYFSGDFMQGLDGGTNVAMAQDWFDENDEYKTAYPSNRWLITPQVRLTSGNYFVWDAISYEDPYLETYRVRISTTNTDTASFTILTTINEEDGLAWQRHAVDLSAYAGQDVYIAIQLISDDMNMLWVDNLKIAGPATLVSDEPEPPEGLTTADGSDINVYPNPTTGVITVAASNITRIEVIDAMGRVAMTQNGSANTMNISALAEGIYTLRVTTENGVSMKRIVKK
jgi:hypothetical protein